MAKKRTTPNRLPGTPESRQADHEQVQETVAQNIRHVRIAIEKLLDIIRQRFKLPLTKGTDAQKAAALYVGEAAQHLHTALEQLPRSQWRDGTFHECPPTWVGEIVPLEHSDDYVQAIEFLRPLASKLIRAANQVKEPITTIPAEWVSGLEESARLLAFVEPHRPRHDKPQKGKSNLPESGDVLELVRYLKKGRGRFGTDIACAREFCLKHEITKTPAQNLLRQAYRFADHWR